MPTKKQRAAQKKRTKARKRAKTTASQPERPNAAQRSLDDIMAYLRANFPELGAGEPAALVQKAFEACIQPDKTLQPAGMLADAGEGHGLELTLQGAMAFSTAILRGRAELYIEMPNEFKDGNDHWTVRDDLGGRIKIVQSVNSHIQRKFVSRIPVLRRERANEMLAEQDCRKGIDSVKVNKADTITNAKVQQQVVSQSEIDVFDGQIRQHEERAERHKAAAEAKGAEIDMVTEEFKELYRKVEHMIDSRDGFTFTMHVEKAPPKPVPEPLPEPEPVAGVYQVQRDDESAAKDNKARVGDPAGPGKPSSQDTSIAAPMRAAGTGQPR